MGNSSSVEEPTQEEGAADEQQSINLLLCGPTGTGKSATGNHILQTESIFKVDDNDVATTQKCDVGYSQKKDIKVVDMPGLEDVKCVVDANKEALDEQDVGYDAVLVIVRYGRQTKQDKRTIKQLKKIYGKSIFKKYGILVVTHGDKFKQKRDTNETVIDYCSQQTGLIKYLWQKCNKRVVLFDNVTEDPKEREAQKNELIHIVMSMKKKNTSRYTGKLHQNFRKKRKMGCVPRRVQGNEGPLPK